MWYSVVNVFPRMNQTLDIKGNEVTFGRFTEAAIGWVTVEKSDTTDLLNTIIGFLKVYYCKVKVFEI
jgi:hypothetical protein